MIHVEHITKRFGSQLAVDDLSFDVTPGVVTGFLGPNGSGKSTTMRVILGLDRATSGHATINGKRYRDLKFPLREVGALLDAKAAHPGRTARNHLVALALANSISVSRVDEVLDTTGLGGVANQRVATYSLGMGQRLGIAAALLGDAPVLLFDEPVNGLDPEGIRWAREFFQQLAHEGRTILVSSHLMSEMAQTAEQLIVIGRGRLIATGSVTEITGQVSHHVIAKSNDDVQLRRALAEHNVQATATPNGLTVPGVSSSFVGEVAFRAGLILEHLSDQRASLEEAYMSLTGEVIDYHGAGVAQP